MKKYARTLLAGLVMLGAASGAHATAFNLGALSDGGTYLRGSFVAPGAFTDTYSFSLSGPGSIQDSFISFLTSKVTVSLTGPGGYFSSLSPSFAGSHTFASLAAGNYSLSFSGTASGIGGLYATLIKSQVAAVPEADTWLMMIIGAGLVAYQLRRKQQSIPSGSIALG